MSPVELFAGVDAQPRFVHEGLRPSLGYYYLPSETSPAAPYAASHGLRRSL